MNAYAFRLKTSGGAYMYWNVSTGAFQSTIVWNALTVGVGGNWSVAIAGGILSNGNVYNWSMASQESGAGLQGVFATDFTFTAQAAPGVAAVSPVGTITGTTHPVLSWSDTLPSGASQIDYQVVVESGTYSTVPGSGTTVWSPGVTASSATSVSTGVGLFAGVSYRWFIQITETGDLVSAWSYGTFVIAANAPAQPILVSSIVNDPTSGLPLACGTFQGQDNQLTAAQASVEGGVTTGWSAGANTTLAPSTAWAQDGSYSLALTATASGNVVATTPAGTSGVACTPGTPIRIMAFFHTATNVRSAFAAVQFYDVAGAQVGGNYASPMVNTTLTGNGAQAFLTMTVPAGAATMDIFIQANAMNAGEDLYADMMLIGPGTSTTWTAGGFVGVSTLSILRSDGVYVREAGWDGNIAIPEGQQVVVYDVDTPPHTSFTYTAIVTATVGGLPLSGPPSAATAAVTLAPTSWDICDPRYPSAGTLIEWGGDSRTKDQPEAQGNFNALARTSSIVVRGQMYDESFDLVLSFGGDNDAGWQAFNALRKTQQTVLLRGDMPEDFHYVALGPSRPMVLKRTGNRVADPSRTLTIHCTPVDKP
jgi:hypothetical protein